MGGRTCDYITSLRPCYPRASARPSLSRRRLRRRPRPHVVHVLAPLNGQLGGDGGGYVNVALELLRPMMSVAEDRSSERRIIHRI